VSRCVAALAFAGVFFVTGQGMAQGYDELGSYDGRRSLESEQYAAVEARVGPYFPKVDDEMSGAPFESTFGDDKNYAFGLEADWQLFRIPAVGTLGPGAGVSYVRYSGYAPLTSDPSRRSEQRTSLWIMPFWGVGVFRVDTFARNVGIPFVPYAKLGVVYALWACSTGDTRCKSADGRAGRGAEFGYMYGAGLMFLLDWLDPQSAREMDNSVGVNNSYFFGELYGSDVDSFGDGMQVGTSTWTLGLAFEF